MEGFLGNFLSKSARSTARGRETANYGIIIISILEENVVLIRSFSGRAFNNLKRPTQERKYVRQKSVSVM